jgi:hypothetical protein
MGNEPRFFLADQDEIVKMATEGDLIRNLAASERATSGSEDVHYAEGVTTERNDDNGPQV